MNEGEREGGRTSREIHDSEVRLGGEEMERRGAGEGIDRKFLWGPRGGSIVRNFI